MSRLTSAVMRLVGRLQKSTAGPDCRRIGNRLATQTLFVRLRRVPNRTKRQANDSSLMPARLRARTEA